MQYGKNIQSKEGMRIAAGLCGHFHSSYRVECFGTILALAAEGPCNIGIDNEACVSTAKQLHELAKKLPLGTSIDSKTTLHHQRDLCKGELAIPWSAQPCGDLHRTMLKHIIANNLEAVKFTKVKGHAETEDIVSGKVTKEQAAGNDQTD